MNRLNHINRKLGFDMIEKLALLSILAVGITIGMLSTASAEDSPDVDEIISRAELASTYQGDDGRSQVRMKIIDGKDRTRYRQFSIVRKDVKDGGDQKYLIVFSRPADIRGTVFMVHKHSDGEDDRWLYLPGLDLVKRISAGDKRTSFVGSHFFYEDVSGRSPEADVHKLADSTDDYWVIESTPRDADAVEFHHSVVWIDKKTYVPRKIEYFDDNDKVFRRIEALKVEEIQGNHTVMQSRVTDLRSGGKTLMEFRKVSYDLGIPDDIFSERSLRRPPQKWIKVK